MKSTVQSYGQLPKIINNNFKVNHGGGNAVTGLKGSAKKSQTQELASLNNLGSQTSLSSPLKQDGRSSNNIVKT